MVTYWLIDDMNQLEHKCTKEEMIKKGVNPDLINLAETMFKVDGNLKEVKFETCYGSAKLQRF